MSKLKRQCRYKYFYDDLKPSKVGQGDLVFGVRSGCASGRSQVSVYSGYDLCHPGCPIMFFVQFDVFDPVTYTHDANLVTAGQLLAEIMQI